MAVAPVPNIVPSAMTTLNIGYIIFTAEKASVPIKRDTNIPSTTVYNDINIIIIMDGKVNRNSEPKEMGFPKTLSICIFLQIISIYKKTHYILSVIEVKFNSNTQSRVSNARTKYRKKNFSIK
jgi:hypothetical protein